MSTKHVTPSLAFSDLNIGENQNVVEEIKSLTEDQAKWALFMLVGWMFGEGIGGLAPPMFVNTTFKVNDENKAWWEAQILAAQIGFNADNPTLKSMVKRYKKAYPDSTTDMSCITTVESTSPKS